MLQFLNSVQVSQLAAAATLCMTVLWPVSVRAQEEMVVDVSGMKPAMEYLLEQDPDNRAEVSFRINGTAKSIEELTEAGEQISDEISAVLFETGKNSYQASQYPCVWSGVCLNYWYDESLSSCIGCVLENEDDGLQISLFLQGYPETEVDWCELPFGLSYGSDNQEIEAAIQNYPYFLQEVYPGTNLEESTYIVLTPGSDQVEYIQLRAGSYLWMQNWKIQAENDVIIPVSHCLYNAVYYMDEAEDISAKIVEVADELDKKWDGNWTNGYRRGNWSYSLSTEEYLKGDPLLETEFWKNWGEKIFSWYCCVAVGDSQMYGHAVVSHEGKGVMPVELFKAWNVY